MWNIQNTLYSVHFDTRQPFQMQLFPHHFPNAVSQPVSSTSDWQGYPQAGFPPPHTSLSPLSSDYDYDNTQSFCCVICKPC